MSDTLRFMVCRNENDLLDVYFSDRAAEFDVEDDDIDSVVFGYEEGLRKEQVFNEFDLYLLDELLDETCH